MDTEALAVAKIQTMLGRCSHLKAVIATNDKTPFTDGYIDLYDALGQSKKDWRGRVTVQVKGRAYKARRGMTMSFSIDRVDLIAFQKDSGVLYFVVAIDKKTQRRIAFFKLLSPFGIEAILRDAPADDARVPVTMERLPEAPAEIESIVAVALKTRAENVALGFDPALFENAVSFTLYTPFDIDFDSPVTFAPGSSIYSLVLNTSGGLSIPLGGELHVLPGEYTERVVDLPISAGGIQYETAVVHRVDENTVRAMLSEGLSLTFKLNEEEVSVSVSLTLADILPIRAKAVEFFTALLFEQEPLVINGTPSQTTLVPTSDEKGLRSHQQMLRDLSKLFDRLGVDAGLVDLGHFDDAQIKQLRFLFRAFVLDEEITDQNAEIARVLQSVGRWNVMYLISPGSGPGKWRLIDPFAPEIRGQFRMTMDGDQDSEPIPVTAYETVMPEDIGSVLNARFESIVDAYEQIADLQHTDELANQRVLALITAADLYPGRKDELLGAARSLNSWLLARNGRRAHHVINELQIERRFRSLTSEQKKEIREIKRAAVISPESNALRIEVACALLLEDPDEVTDLIGRLPEGDLELIKTWPIWSLSHNALGTA